MWVVAAGSPWDGITLYGEFTGPDEAAEWAERQTFEPPDWWTVEVKDKDAD